MNIQTKYSIGDKVFSFVFGDVFELEILEIQANILQTKPFSYKNIVTYKKYKVVTGEGTYTTLDEKDLFSTLEELTSFLVDKLNKKD